MVRSRAWCRADLAGGTLDIWPLGLLHRGARTVNLALSLAARATLVRRSASYVVRQGSVVAEASSAAVLARTSGGELAGLIVEDLELPPVEISLESDSPRGGGLGASSALAVALLAAGERLSGQGPLEPRRIARRARDLEARLMGLPTGLQDHYPALLGGVLEIRHLPGGETVRVLDVDADALGRLMLIVYSGQSHFSAANNWEVIRRRLEGDPETTRLLEGITEVAREMPAALERADFSRVGELIGEEWNLRRHLSPASSTPRIEDLLRRAVAAGAWGGKACGAGGGGCLVVLCPPEKRKRVEQELTAAGGEILAARPVTTGIEVTEE